MYDYHYNCIDAKMLFTDTGSLIYEIKTDDVYEDFYEDKICLILVIIQNFQSFMIIQYE